MAYTARMADRDCRMNLQIAVLLDALSRQEIDLPEGLWIETYPYGNFRERGFVLSLRGGEFVPFNIAFSEYRSSDAIRAIPWRGRLHLSGVVRGEEIPPTIWDQGVSFDWMDIQGCIRFARRFIMDAIKIISSEA
jgi:hypothetical protein